MLQEAVSPAASEAVIVIVSTPNEVARDDEQRSRPQLIAADMAPATTGTEGA